MSSWKDLREVASDNWSDFCESVITVAKERSVPQLLAVSAIVLIFTVGMILLWAILSLVIALPVWGLWNWVMPGLGVAQVGYLHAYGLTLLCAILFRGNSVTLPSPE